MARFLYERACGAWYVLLLCVAVRPSVRSVSGFARTFRWVLRGSARWTESSGLGDAAASFPAGGGAVREADAASRTVVPSGAVRRRVSTSGHPRAHQERHGSLAE